MYSQLFRMGQFKNEWPDPTHNATPGFSPWLHIVAHRFPLRWAWFLCMTCCTIPAKLDIPLSCTFCLLLISKH